MLDDENYEATADMYTIVAFICAGALANLLRSLPRNIGAVTK